jgi:hypothetical protein
MSRLLIGFVLCVVIACLCAWTGFFFAGFFFACLSGVAAILDLAVRDLIDLAKKG